jgi:hypothetical protein
MNQKEAQNKGSEMEDFLCKTSESQEGYIGSFRDQDPILDPQNKKEEAKDYCFDVIDPHSSCELSKSVDNSSGKKDSEERAALKSNQRPSSAAKFINHVSLQF